MEVFISLLTAIIGAAASIGVNYYNQQKTEEANKANIQAANAAQQSNQEFNRESAAEANAETRRQYWELYSPVAKVKQLRQAGLSVGLMYGGGNVGGNGGSAAQAASAPANIPTIQPNLMSANFIQDILQAAKAPSEIKKTEKEAQKTIAETANARITFDKIIAETKETKAKEAMIKTDTTIKDQQIKLNEIAIKWEKETYQTKKDILDSQLEQMECTIEETIERINGLTIENSKKNEMIQAAIDLQTEQKNKFIKDTLLTDAETKLTELKQGLQRIENDKAKKTAENYIKQAEKSVELLQEQIDSENERQKQIRMDSQLKQHQDDLLRKEKEYFETKMYGGMLLQALGMASKMM